MWPQAARLPGVTARPGDARDLPVGDAAYDVVLLLGPLYHLPERADPGKGADRGTAGGAAPGSGRRGHHQPVRGAARPLHEERYFEPGQRAVADAVSEDGRLASQWDGSLFTTAYLAQPAETPAEFAEAGLAVVDGQYGVEGIAWLMGGVESGWPTPSAGRPSSRPPGVSSPSRRCSARAAFC